MQKSCGSCTNWLKLGSFKGKGICELFDMGWVPSDYVCDKFKKIKNKPKKSDIVFVIIDEMGD